MKVGVEKYFYEKFPISKADQLAKVRSDDLQLALNFSYDYEVLMIPKSQKK